MPRNTQSSPRKYMPYLKDIIYIITLLATIGGFLYKQGQQNQKQEYILEKVISIESNMTDFNDFIDEQLEINGGFVMYIKLKERE